MTREMRDRIQGLQRRWRLLAQRARSEAKTRDDGSYLRGYHIGLAVGYEEAVKKLDRLRYPAQKKAQAKGEVR